MTDCAATGVTTTSRSDGFPPGVDPLEALLPPLLHGRSSVAVAFSGGLDSTALLHALARCSACTGTKVHALHVHHGLSPYADAWEAHCRSQCLLLGVTFHTTRVDLDAQSREGIEAQARRLRYEALARMARAADCLHVFLAHHRDDQAETVLLQALRGGGIAGLAAMPAQAQRVGLTWLRPWLGQPRSSLSAYVQRHGLSHVEDESNASPRHARNRLRHQVMPALALGFPGVAQALAQVASQAQDALACLEELAAIDLAAVQVDAGLDVRAWHALSPARRSNVLRAWLRQALGQTAPRSLVARLMMQLRPGLAPHRWPASRGVVALYRDVLYWCAPAPVVPDQVSVLWRIDGAGAFPVPGQVACLSVEPVLSGPGVPLSALGALSWRTRCGGEQFQRHVAGVPRSLKKVFQEVGVPAWAREVPLLYAGDTLLFVPGLGVDARHLKPDGEALMTLQWQRDGVAGVEAGQTGKI